MKIILIVLRKLIILIIIVIKLSISQLNWVFLYILQKILRPSQGLQKPYIKPTDDDLQKILRPSQRSTNQFFQTTKTTTTTTAKNPEKKVFLPQINQISQ